ncbi:MAG: AAA family ATPase, partial [Verrucomicrobiae bacterium]|nr:AAA family ATPase [Verrucomicrobiae bacterium]
MPTALTIADRVFSSRLLVGTGKFPSNESMRDALEASGTEIVTVALRRADLSGKHDPFANILDFIDPERYLLLPNTSGAMNAAEAVRLARLAATAGLPKWVKLEIHPDPTYLLPDPIETFEAAKILTAEGFTVLPYINADPVLAKRLQEEAGTATVMPLGAPIGSNRGLDTRRQIEIIIEQATVPVVVDAGIGAPSHAAAALEMGADAVLVNTAIAIAEAIAPCVLWIDELEKAFAGSGSSGSSDGGTSARVFGSLLNWLQEKTSPVFVVATANDISKLPPELLRKGRWDECWFVDLPDTKERAAIWDIVIEKFGRERTAYDTVVLARASELHTGAEIEAAFVEAMHRAFTQDREPTELDLGEVL